MNQKLDNFKERVNWIDLAKGITIILTIVGHCVGSGIYGGVLRGLIFSFHMPLFFILSCLTFNFSKNENEFKNKTIRAFKHLICPALFIFGLMLIWQCYKDNNLLINLNFWKGKLYTLIFSSGVDVQLSNMTVEEIGIPWFFFALFFGRTIFDYIQLNYNDEKKLFIISIIVGIIGIILGKIQWLPFSLDVSFSIQPLLFFGYFLKRFNIQNMDIKKIFFCAFVWLITLFLTFSNYNNATYLEFAARRYNLFPICYICAIAGTLFVVSLSTKVCKFKVFKPLIFIGRNSLYLLCIHYLDEIFINFWCVNNHQFYTALCRTFFDLLLFFIFMGIKSLIKNQNMKAKLNYKNL